jgi:hypothetical protein
MSLSRFGLSLARSSTALNSLSLFARQYQHAPVPFHVMQNANLFSAFLKGLSDQRRAEIINGFSVGQWQDIIDHTFPKDLPRIERLMSYLKAAGIDLQLNKDGVVIAADTSSKLSNR